MMASDLSSGCTETIDLDDEKEEGEISLEDVSSSEEGGMGHLTSSYIIGKTRMCPDCKSWGECRTWCNATYHKSQGRRDPVKGKENRHHIRETGYAATKHTASTLQEKNDDLVPISSDSDMEIVGLTDTSNRKAKVKKKKRKKKYEPLPLTIDDLISPSTDLMSIAPDISSIKIYREVVREVSPVHRPSGRSKMISRSPIRRYKSPVVTRSLQSSRSPLNNHSRSPILTKRNTPRKVRSPKRSLRRHSPVRATAKRPPSKLSTPPSKPSSSPSTRSYANRDGDVTRLLKKVRHLDSIGAHASQPSVGRGKESSSLKEKLFSSNILKRSDSDDHAIHLKGKSKIKSETVNDADDEDDLALLRQKALETKQKKSNRYSDHPADVESERRLAVNTDDDQDEEALQLRMIALRSAVMKKHQNRVRRGIKTKRSTRSESPFGTSFLDDIPVPSDELLKFASPPRTPSLTDSNHIEDMDLDTDVEREKEKLPYSPTDKITENVPIDTALLGIEPSDVSFINVNETVGSPVFDDTQDELAASGGEFTPYNYNNTYLPFQSLHASPNTPQYYAHSPSQYVSETFHPDLSDASGKGRLETPHGDGIVCGLIDGICCQEGIYSSTSVSDPLPVSKDLLAPPVCPHGTFASSFQMPQIAEQPPANNDGTVFVNVDTAFGNDMSVYETQTDAPAYSVAAIAPTAMGYAESMSPNESMVTIDDLPETDADPLNPLVADDRNLPATEYIPKEAAAPCQAAAEETLREPLYMQGIPDVTKDTNKIPTLINRTLVPAPILKSNKRLRQCLKKRETAPQPEPTFKNAEMQPVTVTAADAASSSSSVFKPIKLQVAKKSASVLSTLATFDSSASESLDLVSEDQGDQGGSLETENHEAAELSPPEIADTQGAASGGKAAPATRDKKRKRTKRKSSDTAHRLLESAKNPCSDAGVHRDAIADASTSDHVAIESGQSGSNGNAAQEETLTGKSPIQSVADAQEFVNSGDNVTTEKRNTEENGRATPSTFVEYLQKESRHCLSTNPAATDHSESGTVDKVTDTTKHNSRRQSVDEDEDELRAILLASLKRAKSTDASSPPAVPTAVAPVAPTVAPVTNSAATSVQSTAALKTAAGAAMPSVANATCTTAGNNAPSLPAKPLTSSEAEKKKINDASVSVQNNGRKRGGSLDAARSTPKKVPKKALTSTRVVNNAKKALTSTKVVNNAKKYQNMIVQRRLNLRKLDNSAKPNEIVWPNVGGASKISPHASDTQRFVISLGSDSTDDSESADERDAPAPAPVAEKPQAHQEIPADFEKNLNKFLREMRNEQEQSAAKSSGSSSGSQATKRGDVPQVANGSSNVHTPLAVRHLPASQQEEYRRLKQQILEREKLKLQRKVASNNSHNGSGSSNKLSNANAASSSAKSSLPCEKKAHVKPNQDKLKTPEVSPQEPSTEVGRKSDDATRGVSELNVCPVSADNLSASVSKHTNVVQIKSGKKIIPNNLSIRITNVTSASQPGGRTVENSREKQSARDKPQHRATLRTLSTDEINLKYMQVLLKQDTVERVVTISEKPALQRDSTTAGVDQGETLASEPDVNQAEILNEKNVNNVDGIDTSCFSNASTVKLSGNSSASRQEDTTMETTMTLSQYEAERQREIERDTSTAVLADNGGSSSSSNSSPKSDTAADDNGNPKDVWNAFKKDVKAELNSLMSLPKVERERYLRETEHKLVAKRYMVLDHLAEMSGNLRQWDMEKDVQTILAGEVRKLKEQLKVAEERLQQQRERVSSMGPKVSTARQKINTGQRECFKLSEVCSTLGNRLMGKNYKLPEAVTQLLNDKLKEVANHTRQFTKKKRLQSNDISENSYSSSLQEISDSSKDSEENLSLQEQPTNGAAVIDEAGSKSDTSRLTQSNQDKSPPIPETSLDFSISENREETLANTPNHNEDVASLNRDSALSSEPKLYQSSSTKQNNEHTEGSRTDESEPAVSSELKSSATDSSSQKCNEQNNKKASTQLPSSSPTPSSSTATTTTDVTTTNVTTMTTTTMKIAPYVSILTHLKKPRNINPHGILCPYEMQGICRDEDCQYIHQSRNQT